MGVSGSFERRIAQFFSFDPAEYRAEISSLSKEELQAEHARIKRRMLSAGTQIVAGGAGAAASGGTSLLFSVIGGRRVDVNSQRRDVIEALLNERGWEGRKLRFRDVAGAIGPKLLMHGIGPDVDLVTDHLVEQATDHATDQAADASTAPSGPSSDSAVQDLGTKALHKGVRTAATTTASQAILRESKKPAPGSRSAKHSKNSNSQDKKPIRLSNPKPLRGPSASDALSLRPYQDRPSLSSGKPTLSGCLSAPTPRNSPELPARLAYKPETIKVPARSIPPSRKAAPSKTLVFSSKRKETTKQQPTVSKPAVRPTLYSTGQTAPKVSSSHEYLEAIRPVIVLLLVLLSAKRGFVVYFSFSAFVAFAALITARPKPALATAALVLIRTLSSPAIFYSCAICLGVVDTFLMFAPPRRRVLF